MPSLILSVLLGLGHSPAISALTEPERPEVHRIELPVNWQVTRASFTGSETNTQTESYRESWFLEIGATGEAYVTSRRARVGVYRSGAMKSVEGLPAAIVMSEEDFARLIGLLPQVGEGEAGGAGNSPSVNSRQSSKSPVAKSLVTIALTPDSDGIDLTLRLSDDEHFNVHHEVGALNEPKESAFNAENAASQ